MTDCQAHAQQQEQEQQETEALWQRQRLMSGNHGKMIGCAQTIRDAKGDEDYVRIAVKYPVAIDSKITAIYNFEGENHLSNEKIEKKKYAKYDKLYEEEKENIWLKKFQDRERAEFAIKQKRRNIRLRFCLSFSLILI